MGSCSPPRVPAYQFAGGMVREAVEAHASGHPHSLGRANVGGNTGIGRGKGIAAKGEELRRVDE